MTALYALRETEGRVGGGRRGGRNLLSSHTHQFGLAFCYISAALCCPWPSRAGSESSQRSAGSLPAQQHSIFGVGSFWPTAVAVNLVGG